MARNSRGQSVVEFALVLPLLFLIVFGITEFGRAWLQMNVATSAAREGARLAVVTASDVARVTARVRQVCDSGKVDVTNITVSGPDATDPDRRVTVTVEFSFRVVTGTVLNTFSGTIPMRASATMRHEAF